jgi:hypothetical protein
MQNGELEREKRIATTGNPNKGYELEEQSKTVNLSSRTTATMGITTAVAASDNPRTNKENTALTVGTMVIKQSIQLRQSVFKMFVIEIVS